MPKKNTFGGLNDMPQPSITRVKVPPMKMGPRPPTLVDVVTKMDELESAENDKETVADYELIWVTLRNWVEAHA